MMLTVPGFTVLGVHAGCGACGARAALAADEFEFWCQSHYMPVADAAYVQDPAGSEFWLAIAMGVTLG